MRIHDPRPVNEIANIPQVAAALGAEAFDFTDVMADKRNIVLWRDRGVAVCMWCAPRVFEVHLFYHPDTRTRNAINASISMGDYMMTYHADMLWGQPKMSNRAAIWHIRQVRFEHAGDGHNPLIGDVSFFVRKER